MGGEWESEKNWHVVPAEEVLEEERKTRSTVDLVFHNFFF